MKKLFLVLASFLVVLSGCDNSYDRSSDAGEIVEISYKEYEEMKKDDGPYMVLISQTNCSHCIDYKENVLNEYMPEHGFTIYELNLTNEEDPQGVYDALKEELGDAFKGTPSTIMIEKKEVAEFISGTLTEDELEDLVVEYQLDKK